MQEAPRPTIHCVLVHGTYARNAAWCKPGSSLRETLAWDNDPIKFYEYPWSAWNRIGSRAKAAGRLEEWVRANVLLDDNSRLVLIGHSHGGPLIWQALRNAGFSSMVDGVATLSIPFLHFRLLQPGTFQTLLSLWINLFVWFIWLIWGDFQNSLFGNVQPSLNPPGQLVLSRWRHERIIPGHF